ncbi:MAG TPA: hydrogen peroxide-dependent heme synthase [Longimicrobium sp.]|nr:hydrogen peroxide-dependent heme synthase [Longimicrobium sp.]
MPALAPATLEGWYALHQMFAVDWHAVRELGPKKRAQLAKDAAELFGQDFDSSRGGWSGAARLVGAAADLLCVHFRPSLDALADVQRRIRDSELGEVLHLDYDYLSVTEAGLYHATAEAAREADPGSEAFQKKIEAAMEAERASPHIRTRLYPQVPDGMRYVSFYPMSKRRAPGQNWYTLDVAERARLMRDHGLTGRKYAGRIFQVITGSVGLDDWEWGVTLFARDPLDFKRIVTEMRYDEASAVYGEFGRFFTGIRFAPEEWATLFGAR